jgi:hypothetical protein
MPDDNTSGATQADASDNTSAQAATTTSTDAQAAKSQQDYERMIADLRKENAAHRTKLKTFEDAQAKADADKLTETERLQKQASDLQSKYDSDTTALTERIMRYEVERLAGKLGIIDPDAAAQLIDWDALEFNENGMPTNAETLLKDLLKAKPYLAGRQAGSMSGGATNPSRTQTGSVGQITRDNLEQAMKDYNTLSPSQKAEVTRLLTNRR